MLLSGGGTAGHITPLLAIARELHVKSPEIQLMFIGHKGDKNIKLVENSSLNIHIETIFSGKFRRFNTLSLVRQVFNFGPNLLNLRDLIYNCVGFVQSLGKLIVNRPDVILFKGGFVVVPLGMAARLLRIDYITHDSDSLPGLANKLIAKGAKYNAVVHKEVKYYPLSKTKVTGIPLAKEYLERAQATQQKYKKVLGIPEDSFMLFVFTGTQGSRSIDKALSEAVPKLLERHKHLYLVHVFGRLNEDSQKEQYAGLSSDLKSRIRKLLFIENAFDYIAAADLIIGRAGATSIAEFATIGRACVIIPAAQLTGGHQLENAQLLSRQDAAIVLNDNDELAEALYKACDSLIADKKRVSELAKNIQQFGNPEAASKIAELLIEVGSKNGI